MACCGRGRAKVVAPMFSTMAKATRAVVRLWSRQILPEATPVEMDDTNSSLCRLMFGFCGVVDCLSRVPSMFCR